MAGGGGERNPPLLPPYSVGGEDKAEGEEIVTHSPEETLRWGGEFARRLRSGDVVALAGELGAGKTLLAQGICAGLGFEGEVTSPSFVRVHTYEVGKLESWKVGKESREPRDRLIIYHADFYLIRDRGEAMDLGLDELYGGDNIVLVEWAQRFPELLPEGCWWVEIELGERENVREIRVGKLESWKVKATVVVES